MAMSAEEAAQRMRESRKRYRETHKDEIAEMRRAANTDEKRAKRREETRAHIAKLVEAGVYVPLKPGRPRLYEPQEALEIAKRQRRESYARRKERLDAAKALLVQAEGEEA